MAPDNAPLRGPLRRDRLFTWAVVSVFGLILLRLFTMQVLQGSRYRELSEENRIRVEVLTAPRGEIRDRKGRLLADSVPSFTVTLDPYDLAFQDASDLLDSTIVRLGEILAVPPDELREKVKQ